MKNKLLLFVHGFWLMSGSLTAQSYLSFPAAKFKTGNDIAWKEPDYDDSSWPEIKTSILWERQGFAGYDGFAWYRIHFFLPTSLLEKAYLKDKLNLYLARIDDADEVYLNGKLIGKTGSSPADPEGYVSRFDVPRNYAIDTKDPAVHWNGDNVLAIKVYDGQGGGGIYGDVPSLQLYDLIDGLAIDQVSQNDYTESKYEISLRNTLRETQKGFFQITVEDTYEGKIISSIAGNIKIMPLNEWRKTILIPGNKRMKINITFTDDRTGRFKTKEIISSYILTPPAPAQPRINGPKVYGARPDHPFLFTIAASGLRPMTFGAEGLPAGLTLDNSTGVITGKATMPGNYKVILTAKNARGAANGELLIKIGDEIALTPPMGWNSWNCWGLSIDAEKIVQSARIFREKGLTQYGWSYINIDGGWQGERDKEGRIVPNKKFPDMYALGDSIHKMGLKFGIYSSPGPRDCAGYTGSYRHEEQDAISFAGWGADYLKYDWCFYSEVFEAGKDSSTSAFMAPYLLMQKYLREQKRDIVYSLCQYGFKDVWEWGASVGNSWRTTWDITDTWESLRDIGFNQYPHYPFAGPGHWNDPDMLIVGKVGWGENLHDTRLTPDEQYTHISLWSLLASPLLIGCDVSRLDAFTLNLLTNPEVIEINQDPLGKQARRLIVDGNIQVWVKELEDGSKAVGVFNLGDKDINYDLIASSLGYPAITKARDVWRQVDIPGITTSVQMYLPAHGVKLIKISAFSQKEIVINNLKPRFDTEGNIIDAHDGRVVKFGGKFYWYGTAYGNTSGFLRSNYFQCYSSVDLTTWKKEGKLLENPPSGIYYRPHVIYNSKTRQYVLWYNWYPQLWDGKYGVAVSDSPTGPFKIINTDVKVQNSKYGVGDFGLFVDDDGTAYIAYNTIDGHKGSIEKLSNDYRNSAFDNGGFLTEGCEAGAIFKRNGIYYLLTDYTCCFCTQGSGVRVYVSDNPMKGYRFRNNINRYPGTPAGTLVDGMIMPNIYSTLKRKKDSAFCPVQINFSGTDRLNSVKIYQFTGNRYMCCDSATVNCKADIGIADFDLFMKQRGEWVKVSTKKSVESTSVYNIITLKFEHIPPQSMLLRPMADYPYNEIYLNKIELYNDIKKVSAPGDGVSAFINDGDPMYALPIIPAQQTFVMPLKTSAGLQYIWMGDLWGSANDNIKGHDYQYWGAPLVFDANGDIEAIKWVDKWNATIAE